MEDHRGGNGLLSHTSNPGCQRFTRVRKNHWIPVPPRTRGFGCGDLAQALTVLLSPVKANKQTKKQQFRYYFCQNERLKKVLSLEKNGCKVQPGSHPIKRICKTFTLTEKTLLQL